MPYPTVILCHLLTTRHTREKISGRSIPALDFLQQVQHVVAALLQDGEQRQDRRPQYNAGHPPQRVLST